MAGLSTVAERPDCCGRRTDIVGSGLRVEGRQRGVARVVKRTLENSLVGGNDRTEEVGARENSFGPAPMGSLLTPFEHDAEGSHIMNSPASGETP